MRKERVLHARIPVSLDRELKKRSANLGLSVSTVVRNALLHTFDLVEGIVLDGTEVARVLRRGTGSPAAEAKKSRTGKQPDEVLGWQELTLNINAVCDTCNRALARGTRAAVGVPVSVRPVVLCPKCLAASNAASKTSASVAKPRPKKKE